MSSPRPSVVRTAESTGGVLIYLIESPPQCLPPVRTGELADAWRAAHDAASGQTWGAPRLFRFLGEDGPLDLALNDDDACCWAAALDSHSALSTPSGLAVCIRLLALIALIARAPWLERFCRITRAGARLEPALLRVAATVPLDRHAGFDDDEFRERLGHAAPLLAPNRFSPGALT